MPGPRITRQSLDASLQTSTHRPISSASAKDRGQFTDIHDIGGTDPKDYDVLITDIQRETLEKKIAEELGIPYLSKATESDAKKVIEVGDSFYMRKQICIRRAQIELEHVQKGARRDRNKKVKAGVSGT